MQKQRLLTIRFFSTLISGGLLMLWGVMNLSLQMMSFFERPSAGSSETALAIDTAGWTWSWTMSLLFSVAPFLFGLTLYLGVFKKAARARALQSPPIRKPGSP